MSSPIDYDTLVKIDALGTADIPSLYDTMIGPYTITSTHIGATAGGITYPTAPLPTYGNITIGNAGAAGAGSYYTNGTGAKNWASITGSNKQSSLQVHGDAEFEGKVMINGRNISEFMETISKRLAILVPDPEKLEHFEALKKAYNHYKTLEALCEVPKKEEDK